MKLSTRSRYGMRALLDIAVQSSREPVRLREIARRQDVSLSYLEHIVGPLIAGGILRSTRGPGGGVSLLKKPEDISLREVMTLLEGPLSAADCVLHPGVCPRADGCATRSLWVSLSEAMDAVLKSRTLADLLRNDEGVDECSCAPDAMRPLGRMVSGIGAVRCKEGSIS